eukprot:8540163-Pyramimonas_sp.AAC.1
MSRLGLVSWTVQQQGCVYRYQCQHARTVSIDYTFYHSGWEDFAYSSQREGGCRDCCELSHA